MNHSEFRPEVTPHGIKIGNTTIDYVGPYSGLMMVNTIIHTGTG